MVYFSSFVSDFSGLFSTSVVAEAVGVSFLGSGSSETFAAAATENSDSLGAAPPASTAGFPTGVSSAS